MAHFFVTHIAILSNIVSSYWLSQNRLSWLNASNYCQTRCGSQLASIHDINDHLKAKYLINNSSTIDGFESVVYASNVWIGLNKLDSTWGWSDNSSFDYGNNVTGGIYPWSADEPNQQGMEHCVEYFANNLWNDEECHKIRRFLCNSCEGLLDKYILYRTPSTYPAALDFCQNTLGTSLASIHSTDDMDEAKYLCQSVKSDCWIGLDRINNPGNFTSFTQFEWTDGTKCEYGCYDVIPGDYPWSAATIEPNNQDGNEYCIEISGDWHNWEWNDNSCDNIYYFLCNKPNELCYQYQWQPMYIPHSDIMFEGCSAKSIDYGPAVISNKRWNNNSWPLKIQYIFAVHNKNINGDGDVGITIYHTEAATQYYDICDYYFVGITIDDAGNVYFVRDKVRNEVKARITSSSVLFTMQYNRYYRMVIDIINDHPGNGGKVTISWSITHDNGADIHESKGSYPDSTSALYAYTESNKYIGISNANTNITAKSLYISGTPEYNFGAATVLQCTLPPSAYLTSDPTIDPTSDPTSDPTTDPTKDPTDDPSVSPTTVQPTGNPTKSPSNNPTGNPSISPSDHPSISPTTATPTSFPSTAIPTATYSPTIFPTNAPSNNPSVNPTITSSDNPSYNPSNNPTKTPTEQVDDGKDGSVDITTTNIEINDGSNKSKSSSIDMTVYICFGVIGFLLIIIAALVMLIKWKNITLKMEANVANNIGMDTIVTKADNPTMNVAEYQSDLDIDSAPDTITHSGNIGVSAFGGTPINLENGTISDNQNPLNEGVNQTTFIDDDDDDDDMSTDDMYTNNMYTNNVQHGTSMGVTDDGNRNSDTINGVSTTRGQFL